MTRPGTSARGQKRRAGMGSHHATVGVTDVWLTPPGIIEAIGLEYELDPATIPGGVPWIPAARTVSLPDDGLAVPWSGRVWLNPPYGKHTGTWLRRLAAHGDGIALVFARTETEWWHDTVPTASAVCFIHGRLTFVDRDRQPGRFNGGAPSALIAWGEDCARAVAAAQLGMTFAVRSREVEGQASLWE